MNQLHTVNLVFERRIKGHLPVTRLAVSDSGSVMVAVPDEHQPRLYHLVRIAASGDGEELGTFSVETLSHKDFSEDGRILVATTDDDAYVFRDDVKTRFFPDRRDNYTSISVSASGELLAVGSADMILSGYSVTLARTSGATLWTKDLTFSVTSVRIAGDGSRILVGSDEGKAIMLDSSRGAIWQLDGDDSIAAAAVSDSIEASVLGTKGGAVLAVGALGNKLWEIVGDGPVVDCAVSSDGKLIAAARTTSGGAGLVEFYDINGVALLEHGDISEVTSVACSRDGRFAAISCDDGTLQILEVTLASARARSADMVKSLFEEGCAAAEKGDHAVALQTLTRLLELSPCHLDACRKLAEVRDEFACKRIEDADRLASDGEPARAVQELQAAAEVCPYDARVFEKLTAARENLIRDALAASSSFAAGGRLEEALAKVEDVIQLDPANVQAREQLSKLEDALVAKHVSEADAALVAGQPERAVHFLERASDLRSSPELQKRLANARARQAFDEGLALYEAKKYSQAAFQFRKVLNIDPDNAEAQKYIEYAESLRQDDTLFDRFSKLE